MKTDVAWVAATDLATITSDILETAGLDGAAASRAADALVTADLRGVDSHGVSNMLRSYVRWLGSGHVNADPHVSILRDAPATMVCDCDGGLGVAVGPPLMEQVISRAETFGIAFATAINARHLGMLAYHAMLALPHDMIGICATAGPPRMVPTFGREARLGTNPVAIAVPAGARPPFVFDAASTVVPVNKITLAQRLGTALPPGLFVEPDGGDVRTPRVPTSQDSEHLAPVGSRSETGSHKGYGLGASIEILCSILSGAPYGMKAGPDHFNHFFAALKVSAFNDVDRFKSEVDEFLDVLNDTPPAAGHERVVYAGEVEWETYRRRSVEGIPLHPEVVGWFRDHCRRNRIDASALG